MVFNTSRLKMLHFATVSAVLCITLLKSQVGVSLAQQVSYWARQERIPGYYDNTEEPPYLIADQMHVVHAFNSQPVDLARSGSSYAIYYREWTLEDGWTLPNDILYYEPAGSIKLVSVVADRMGIVHLIFLGDDLNLYYTHALLSEAGSATGWAEPQNIAEQATRSGTGFEYIGTLAVSDDADNLLLIYSGSMYGPGLYYVFSLDGGITWSLPDLVFLATGDDFVVTDPELLVSGSGIFHAVWTHFQKDGAAGSGYYEAWDPTTQSWSKPIELDIPGVRTPSIIEHDDVLFVSYYHVSTNGNWWRRSSDGGITWTTPAQVSPRHKGTNGGLSFVVDGGNTLHAFFGERIDDNNHGIWHSIWNGTAWSNPEAVVKGPQIRDVIGGDGFDPRSARAIVINGNVLLVTWGTDGFGGLNGAWYSYKQIDAPETVAQPLSSPTAINQGSLIENTLVITPTFPSEELPKLLNDTESPKSVLSSQMVIFIGVVPVILLLTGFVVLRYFASSKN